MTQIDYPIDFGLLNQLLNAQNYEVGNCDKSTSLCFFHAGREYKVVLSNLNFDFLLNQISICIDKNILSNFVICLYDKVFSHHL